MYIKRNIENTIKKVSSEFPVLVLTGARQVGKSTMLQLIKENDMNYVTLDEMGSTLTDYVTFTDLEGEGFTTQTYVDNQIATHEHNTMSTNDADTMFNNLYTK